MMDLNHRPSASDGVNCSVSIPMTAQNVAVTTIAGQSRRNRARRYFVLLMPSIE